jgi:hypothetical protein
VDEQSVLLRAHHGKRGLDHIERAGEVAFDHRAGIVGGELAPRALRNVHAGVVDDDVDAAMFSADRIGDFLHGGGFRHVYG